VFLDRVADQERVTRRHIPEDDRHPSFVSTPLFPVPNFITSSIIRTLIFLGISFRFTFSPTKIMKYCKFMLVVEVLRIQFQLLLFQRFGGRMEHYSGKWILFFSPMIGETRKQQCSYVPTLSSGRLTRTALQDVYSEH
jgi:hypothetical protein